MKKNISNALDLNKSHQRESKIKKKISSWIKYFLVIILAVIFVSLGINAADHYGNPGESIFSRIIFGSSKGPCPSDMVLVTRSQGNFCIDKYENSPSASCPNTAPANGEETRNNLDMMDCKPLSVVNSLPWRNISLDQAMNACAKAGKRLPTPDEWYEASLGTPDPKGNWGPDDCQLNKNWPTQPGPTGSGKNCVSGAGAYDMIGNAWEWVNGQIVDGVFAGREIPDQGYIDGLGTDTLPLTTNGDKPNSNYNEDYLWIKKTGARGIARGGYWDNQSDGGRNAVYMVSPLSFSGVGMGFRCVK